MLRIKWRGEVKIFGGAGWSMNQTETGSTGKVLKD